MVTVATPGLGVWDSMGSSESTTSLSDGGLWSSVCVDSGWTGLRPGEGTSDSGDFWDLLSLERGLIPLVRGSSSSSGRLSSSPAEAFPNVSSV